MFTIENIIDELKEVPTDRLEELYQIVHSLTPVAKQEEAVLKKIMSFAGSFSEMEEKDYSEYIDRTKSVRASLFSRTNPI